MRGGFTRRRCHDNAVIEKSLRTILEFRIMSAFNLWITDI
jgi:hypothetical protein